MVGNISPWNFPFDLSVGPLVEMLAAGNRVVLKPSEHTPACSELLRDMIRATFDRDRVDVAVGGLELAKAFTRVRWDHLLYTGSPEIGRQIAMTAAEQLVPVTLELGGKCPAILTHDSIDAESVKQVLGTKALKNGQMCISVDYCLVPRERMDDFAQLAAEHVRENMPDFSASESNTGMITDRHLERIQNLIEDARSRGCDVRPLEDAGEIDPEHAPAADVDRARPARRHCPHAGGDLRADTPGEGIRRARRSHRVRQRRRAARWRYTSSPRTSRWRTTCCDAPRPGVHA